jgi:hypothetical protein
MPLTHALYVHWLADPEKSGQAVHSGGFAPAHLSESEFSECMNLQNKKKYKSFVYGKRQVDI